MPNPGNTSSSTESPPANRFAKLSLITGTGAALILILMAAMGEMVMQWIGEIESLVLLVFQCCGIVVLAICAIVFGTLGLRDIEADPENEGGEEKSSDWYSSGGHLWRPGRARHRYGILRTRILRLGPLRACVL